MRIVYVKIACQFLIVIVGLNYFNDKVSGIHQGLLTRYYTTADNKRQAFQYFDSLILIQNLIAFVLSWGYLNFLRRYFLCDQNWNIKNNNHAQWIQDTQKQYQMVNASDDGSSKEDATSDPETTRIINSSISSSNQTRLSQTHSQTPNHNNDNNFLNHIQFNNSYLIIGVLIFISKVLFAYLQLTVNLFILIPGFRILTGLYFVYLHLTYSNPYKDQSLWKVLLPAYLLSVGYYFPRIYEQLLPFYLGNYNVIFFDQKVIQILYLIVNILLTCIMFNYLYKLKTKDNAYGLLKKNKQNPQLNKQPNQQNIQKTWNIKTLQNFTKTIELIYAITPYIAACALLYTIFTKQLFNFIIFIWHYPVTITLYIYLAVFQFFKHVFIYYVFWRYDVIVFFVLIGSMGNLKGGHCYYGFVPKISMFCYFYHVVYGVLIFYLIREIHIQREEILANRSNKSMFRQVKEEI